MKLPIKEINNHSDSTLEDFLTYLKETFECTLVSNSKLDYIDMEIDRYCRSRNISLIKNITIGYRTEDIRGHCYEVPSRQSQMYTMEEESGMVSNFSFSFQIS